MLSEPTAAWVPVCQHILREASACLLVQLIRAMRRPPIVERAIRYGSYAFLSHCPERELTAEIVILYEIRWNPVSFTCRRHDAILSGGIQNKRQ